MKTRRSLLLAVLGLGLWLSTGCETRPMRGNSADMIYSTGAAAGMSVPVTGPNSTGSAAGPGSATGINRGGGR